MTLTLRDVMTPSPHTIGEEQPLSRAHEIMHHHGIRHLPVLRGGKITGLVSMRDLHLVETMRDVDPKTVQVSEAMNVLPFAVDPETSLLTVAETMAAMKYGSAVAVTGGNVVGVFTTVDAMRILARLLRDPVSTEAPSSEKVPRASRRKTAVASSRSQPKAR